uniref:hematopoietic SH2 domain-containing protein homolog isoform X2 n=1 Tax=Gasterosteus aculeatus aculeatus TaxID=481459 RepID=UPI001A993D55|nr:hematopoietic SH2 domain-containing protein homolog isoform X2 [Gasterosteus aculeatus aculeatus]
MERSQGSQGAQHDAIAWFTESQHRLVIRNGVVPEWFHGIVSRKEAEERLMSKPPGYFLIRLGESRVGYSLSYRAEDRCRHFMIDTSEDGQYNIVGDSRHHRCLQDLVDFHRRTPIRPFSELLTVPIEQMTENKSDYAELVFPQRSQNGDMNCLPTNSLHSSLCHPSSQEEVPPALSSGTNGSRVWLPGRLYPNLEEEIPRAALPLPAQPVTGRRCTSGDPPPAQPPRVPARASLPLPKRDIAAAQNPLGGGVPFAKNQEAKASVASNLKNLKKRLLKKKSLSQDYAKETERGGTAGNEYQSITELRTSDSQTSQSCTNVELTKGELPYEYLPPPPFAPGF